ncbi:MAG: imidazole glycerol phosphate synthase subunit HisH [Armatimonadota bacterium]|nr:imidazole glycerol phosphate synthase subunit HisH [Armatimonadota bacterium]MDR5676675.1 imidazole glycerol phosphate synthase subunit HisH [Armatimonadota bacterium]MDR5689919.1 imidazole glycerol phosphate synthase subunit HisH [Armatimonadota bacterium]MDR7386008.1 imidazole glycerol phosphate synthase subunit HisH [Armatimonadota bacterium]MDR7388837.1 imidazole glycerol phosphate synthase subunit HisH [Armatimonadota bacterium]
MRAALVDYGAGNLRSVERALARAGFVVVRAERPSDLEGAGLVVLPGVGAFGPAMQRLCEAGFVDALRAWAGEGRPLLGLCLGMQLLFEWSEEDGVHPGLGLVGGRVVRLPPGVKVPHMGWNRLELVRPSAVTAHVRSGEYVYFVHSYYAVPASDCVVAQTWYAVGIPAVVEVGSVAGFQFHPEKSGDVGRRLLLGVREWLTAAARP